MRLRVLATSLIVLLLSIDASAQLRGDRRISTDDRGYRMHPSMVVHAADSGNRRAFVVWGSTTFDSVGSVVLTLYGQQVRGDMAVGLPHQLGSTRSRLVGQVRVLAIGSNFVVLYKDQPYGQGYGTYLQYYNADVDTLGPPALMGARSIGTNSDGIDRYPSVVPLPYGAWRIFWPYDDGSYNGLLSVVVVSTGRVDGIGETVGPIASLPLSYDVLPGLVLLYDPFDFPFEPPTRSRVYYPETDRFDPRTIPNIYNCFHLGSDTSLLVLRDSTLRLYPSLFDTSRSEKRVIPFLGLQPSQSRLLTRDSAGRIVIFYAIGNEGTNRPATCTIARIRLDSLRAPLLLDTVIVIRDSLPQASSHGIVAFQRTAGCNNMWLWEITFGEHNGFPGGKPLLPVFLELDPGARLSQVPGPTTVQCLSVMSIPVRQIPSDTSSSIELVTTDTVRLHAPLARTTPPPHLLPSITVADGRVLATWHEIDTMERDLMRRWFPHEDSAGTPHVYQPPPPERSVPEGAKDISATESVDDSQHRFAGDMMLRYEQHYDARYMYDPFFRQNFREGRTFDTRIALARPGPDGWRGIDTIRIGAAWHSTWRGVFARVLGYDPDDGSVVVLLSEKEVPGGGYALHKVHGYPGSGPEWEYDCPWDPIDIHGFVPLSPGRYLMVNRGRAFQFVGSTVVASFDIPAAGNGTRRYTALRGPRFVMSWIESDSLLLATFDTTGTELGRAALGCAEIGCVDSTLDYSIVESPKDSSIAILVGGLRGVRMAHLGKRLDLRRSDLLVSETEERVAHPAGIFRGDTILAVWEDFREGAPRIYANAFPRYRRLQADTGQEIDTVKREDSTKLDDSVTMPEWKERLTVYPVPATSAINIVLDMTDIRSATIEIVSVTGEELMSMPTGAFSGRWFQARIDLSTLMTGVYFLRVRHKDGIIIRQIMKQ